MPSGAARLRARGSNWFAATAAERKRVGGVDGWRAWRDGYDAAFPAGSSRDGRRIEEDGAPASGWHWHLDCLEEALDGVAAAFDQPRWAVLRQVYAATL